MAELLPAAPGALSPQPLGLFGTGALLLAAVTEAGGQASGCACWYVFGAVLLGVVGVVGVSAWLINRRWPRLPLRAFLWVVTHPLYWIRVYGAENVPATGGALLVCNRVTFLDWLLVMAAQRRYVRFVVFSAHARHWLWGLFLRWAGAIPLDGDGGPKAIVQALRRASDALGQGELVCLFAEGALTRTGFLLPFHRAFEQVLKRCPAPVVPMCLDQVWGSLFSFQGGKVFWKWPQEVPYPVTVAYGAPLPATSKAAEVRLAIQKLSADCASAHSGERMPVHVQFVRQATRHPFRTCLIDHNSSVPVVTYGFTLTGAIIMVRHLGPILGDAEMVGVWLPSSMAGAVTNIGLALLGKVAVNLNYTSAPDFVRSSAAQCRLRHVITSRRFIGRVALPEGVNAEVIYLEDLGPKISRREKALTYLMVLLLPGFLLERWVLGLGKHHLDQLATVIFTSGSCGAPKGVMLTHRNIAANAVSMIQAIGLLPRDRALGVLPFFHSFGYTVTLWVPLQRGASLVYFPDPRQAKEIGELCRKHRCSIYLTTPTFLRFCLRRCEADDFRTLRILICGAEKLPPPLAQEFRDRFGVLPLEGYGCTELSPAAAASVPDVEVNGVRQVANRPGTVGQPLPGVAARVVHPDTLAPLPPGAEGLLLIAGPNVMKGYLGLPDLTAAVIRDGWYVTGDMARIDEDGFVAITGRLSRFAKVGGEMVPLQKIEEELHGLLGTNDHVCAVTSVPDEKKGERVVVLHLPLTGASSVQQLSQQLTRCGLSDLGLPGERDFFQILEMPILGSGKVDLKRVRELALECVRRNGVSKAV